uniref:Secreted protein n=1 Tax=Panagrellus redivivus TaxID=6233 RepID=A0A7E4VI06_PANRE
MSKRSSCLFCFLVLICNPVQAQQCQLGECEKWNMIVIPMLSTRTSDVDGLNNLFEHIVGSCKWYYGYLNLHFVTKDLTMTKFDRVYDLIEDEFEEEHFLYNETQQTSQKYAEVLKYAIRHMPIWPSDYGRYILVLTNFQVNELDPSEADLLHDELVAREIQLRRIRIELNSDRPARMTQIIGRNYSSNVALVSFVDTDVNSLLASVKPCPNPTPEERLEHYKYAQHYQASSWIKANTSASLIGGLLLLGSVIVVICGYGFSLYEKRRAKEREAEKKSQPIIGV